MPDFLFKRPIPLKPNFFSLEGVGVHSFNKKEKRKNNVDLLQTVNIFNPPSYLHLPSDLNPEASAHHNPLPMCFCTRPSEGESESTATRQGNQSHVGDDFDLCRGIFGGSS